MPISNELIEQLLKDCHSPEDLLEESGLLKQLTRKLAERALEVEMLMHPGYTRHALTGNNSGNSRNGTSAKTVRSLEGELELIISCDRNGTFEPKLNDKGEKTLKGFDERIVSLYSGGLAIRDIHEHFKGV